MIPLLLALSLLPLTQETEAPKTSESWAHWRGPLATGEAPDGDPPVTWSESENVRWKVSLPGKGHSTPVVWEGRIFVTTAVPFGDAVEPRIDDAPGAHDFVPVTHKHSFEVIALSLESGEELWRRKLKEEFPHEGGHTTGSYASASPVTDGERLIAFFGSRGLFCLGLDGEVYWDVDLGDMDTKHAHGEASSPALFGKTVVVNWDHEGESFVVALDRDTGEERWRVEREEVTSWSSPIVVEENGKPQVIVPGTTRSRGYDLGSGEVIWECGGLSHNIVASPVAADGMVYIGSSYEKRAMVAIRLEGAKGDITNTDQVAWYRRRGTPYVPSPLLYDGTLYFLNHYQGLLTRVEAKSGKEPHRPVRLPGLNDVYASLVGAADRLYVVDRSGVTAVLSHASPPEILARNILNDSFSASPVIVGKCLLLRGDRQLYCLAE